MRFDNNIMKGEKIRMKDLAERFHEVGVVPVVVLEDAKDAVPLAQALVEGGLPCAEVTFRTAAAEDAMIKAMAAPYTGIKFMPTGGINAKNLEDYLSFDKIVCCGGSWMVKGDLVKAGAFDKIKELTAEARNLVESIRK